MASPFDSRSIPPVTEELLKKLREQRGRIADDDFFGDLHVPLEQMKPAAKEVLRTTKWTLVKYVLLMGTLSLVSLTASVGVVLGMLKLFGVI